MEHKPNYFNLSMNEIVFENKNKDYGAFQLRQLYQKNHKNAFYFTLGLFLFFTAGPALLNYLNVFKKEVPLTIETRTFVLAAPPSINPLQPIKPPPPKIDEVKRPTEKFLEIEAAKKDLVIEPPTPTVKELKDKEIAALKKDSIDKANSQANKDNASNGTNGEGKVWSRVEKPPQFVGGEEAYFKYLDENIDYPLEAEKKKIEGTAWISFVVSQDGSIGQIAINKTSGNKLLDEEAMRVISIMPKYKPGIQNGHPVKTICVLPITFYLPK